MAFKYQALNDSRSSLNSLSSHGSSRSIDSPGGGRQRPRLEFSAAGTCGTNRNSIAAMAETDYPSSSSQRRQRGDGVAKSGSKWRQSLRGEKTSETEEGSSYAAATTDTNSTSGNTTSSCVLQQQNCGDFSNISEAPQHAQNTHSGSMESETGLYIHSSVRSGGSGLRFSRQVSSTATNSDRLVSELPSQNHHHNHHHNQSREHGKLFRALQKFSNKRAQQRVEIEAEKKARKSPQHSGSRTERGREKENVGHQKRSHKSKQGKKGRFPISKSSDLLSGFSDVVYQDNTTDLQIELEVEADTLIYANDTTERLLGDGLSMSHVHHHKSSRGQKYLSMPPSYEIEDDGWYMKASVRRTSSLNEGVYHRCSGTMDTETFPESLLSRSGSKKRSHDLLLCQGESRDLP